MSYATDIPEQYRRAAIYRRQDPQGSQAGRPAGGAAEEVRVGYQSQNSEADRRDDSAECAGAGGQGDQMTKSSVVSGQ